MDIYKIIYELETSLLNNAVRRSVDQLDNIISDDFMEFGSSGSIYNKQDILTSLPLELERKFSVSDFEIQSLSDNVVLATYKTQEESGRKSLRSSIWKKDDSVWQIIFHQGTTII